MKKKNGRVNSLTLSRAITGYDLAAAARRLSPHTLADYHNTFRKFTEYLENDPPLASITPDLVRSFLAAQTVSKKTCLNYYTGLCALWTWAVKGELVEIHTPRLVDPPKPEERDIVPYTEADVRALLGALDRSRFYTRPGKRECSNAQPNAVRNRAILLLLLDTGMRASELCDLKIFHADLKNRHVSVFGKGSKERTLPFGPRTGQAIWKYLVTRKGELANSPLFANAAGDSLDRNELLHMIRALARRAGVRTANVHRFRHTFAINYLRNGGDGYTLQEMLGHTTMDMVKTYLRLAQADLDASHRRTSPVEHWRL